MPSHHRWRNRKHRGKGDFRSWIPWERQLYRKGHNFDEKFMICKNTDEIFAVGTEREHQESPVPQEEGEDVPERDAEAEDQH